MILLTDCSCNGAQSLAYPAGPQGSRAPGYGIRRAGGSVRSLVHPNLPWQLTAALGVFEIMSKLRETGSSSNDGTL